MVQKRIPSLNWLRVFEAAARTESFAAAAKELAMSTPAVSQQIKALETHLKTPLFERHAHSVALTPTARAYLPSVQHAIASVETTTESIFGKPRQETLYVQSILVFAVGFLAARVQKFETRYPDINLHLTTANEVEDFRQHYADLQIGFGAPAAYGRLGEVLLSERLYPVARPEIASQITTPAELLNHQLVEVSSHRSGWQQYFEEALTRSDADYIISDNTVMSFSIAAQGKAIALARAPASDLLQRSFGLAPCLPDLQVQGKESYHLLYKNPDTIRPAARAFRKFLLHEIADLEATADSRQLTAHLDQ